MCAYRTCRRYYNMTKSFIFVLYVPNDCLIYDIKCGAAMSLIHTLLWSSVCSPHVILCGKGGGHVHTPLNAI